MDRSLLFFLLFTVGLKCEDVIIGDITFHYKGSLDYPEPTYCYLEQLTDNSARYSLIASRFKPLGAGTVAIVKDVSSPEVLNNFSNASLEVLFDNLFWPNDVKVAPKGIWNDDYKTLVIADGFILPGTTPGMMYAVGLNDTLDNNGKGESLTGTKWNPLNYGILYTMVDFLPRPDGSYDILATKLRNVFGPIFQPSDTFLVLLEQPSDPDQYWIEHKLARGPDFAFDTHCLTESCDKLGIFTGSFFGKNVSYYILDRSVYPPEISSEHLVDDTAGKIYSVQLTDLNNDGFPELLVSNHEENDTALSGVFVYELPQNPLEWSLTSNFTKHQITNGFIPYKIAPGKAAPGFPTKFYPTMDHSGLPYIFLQGDDNGGYYLLTPLIEEDGETFNFKYRTDKIVQYNGTVGLHAIADTDGDGYVEIFLPDYDHDKIHLWTTKPQEIVD